MSLYYEAAGILETPNTSGGSLKSRIFSKKDFKSPPAQIYALVIETCKWSFVLKEIIEKTELLKLERKLTPILSLLLTHDLLLAKRGISLPATHGLRASVERHKARLSAEFIRARIRRACGTQEAFAEYVEAGLDNAVPTLPQHPRWIRINTLRTTLQEQLDTTFKDYERVLEVKEVQKRGPKKLFIDEHIPNLVAVPPNTDLIKDKAYTSGAIIFQDKASCFPAYLLDPLPEDGDVIDSCAAPGNKTTHVACIVASHCEAFDASKPDSRKQISQTIHAFEKDKFRAKTLEKMVGLAGSDGFTKIHGNFDFLKTSPKDEQYKNVGALLLDPSCSGSGIVGRDEMPELHLPSVNAKVDKPGQKTKHISKTKAAEKAAKAAEREAKEAEKRAANLKRKRPAKDDDEEESGEVQMLVDDDGNPTEITSAKTMQERLDALSDFQLSLLLHAMAFPAAKKITYSTCSVHSEENEKVVFDALRSKLATTRGWRVLKRHEQVKGMEEWPVRGDIKYCKEHEQDVKIADEVSEACIRAHKGDGRGTMGFFVCGFVRDGDVDGQDVENLILRDKDGKIMRQADGLPMVRGDEAMDVDEKEAEEAEDDEEWGGFDEEVVVESTPVVVEEEKPVAPAPTPAPVPVSEKKDTAPPAKKKRRQKKKN